MDFDDILKFSVWSNDLDIELTWWKTPKVEILHVAISFVSPVNTTNSGLKIKTAHILSYFESPRHTSICLPIICRRKKSYLITIVFCKCFSSMNWGKFQNVRQYCNARFCYIDSVQSYNFVKKKWHLFHNS